MPNLQVCLRRLHSSYLVDLSVLVQLEEVTRCQVAFKGPQQRQAGLNPTGVEEQRCIAVVCRGGTQRCPQLPADILAEVYCSCLQMCMADAYGRCLQRYIAEVYCCCLLIACNLLVWSRSQVPAAHD
jgi:hypothetical protein